MTMYPEDRRAIAIGADAESEIERLTAELAHQRKIAAAARRHAKLLRLDQNLDRVRACDRCSPWMRGQYADEHSCGLTAAERIELHDLDAVDLWDRRERAAAKVEQLYRERIGR